MSIVQIELSSEMAQTLSPYHDKLPILLELGLREWLKHESQEAPVLRDRILQVLVASGQVEAPKPYTDEKPYIRHTPVPITGKPVSELVVEQRGSL